MVAMVEIVEMVEMVERVEMVEMGVRVGGVCPEMLLDVSNCL